MGHDGNTKQIGNENLRLIEQDKTRGHETTGHETMGMRQQDMKQFEKNRSYGDILAGKNKKGDQNMTW